MPEHRVPERVALPDALPRPLSCAFPSAVIDHVVEPIGQLLHSPRGINASTTRNVPRLSAVAPDRATATGAVAGAGGSSSSGSPSASVPAVATSAYTPRQWSA